MADISLISVQELERLWRDNGLADKRDRGLLFEVIAYVSAAGDPRYVGGISRIVKLMTPRGQHIGTVHEVVMPDGLRPHSHPKDYTTRDCSRVRAVAE